jgi:hypothetical protein
MARLEHLANVIRSKNAGPFALTFDILFKDEGTYDLVVKSCAITVETMATLFSQDPLRVHVFNHRAARAIKVTIPRRAGAGSVDDTDIYGTQQHVPLYAVVIPTVDSPTVSDR